MFNNIKNASSLIIVSNKNNFYSKFNNLGNYFFLTNNVMLINNYLPLNFFITNLNFFKKSIFSIFTRRNHYPRLRLILKFRKYISLFSRLGNYKFKFNTFFRFVLFNKKNILRKHSFLLTPIFLNFYINSFLKYKKIFHRNWNILIGGFVPQSFLDLFSKKKWIRKNKTFSFVTNRYMRRNKPKTSFLVKNKKTIVNNFFYFITNNSLNNYSVFNYLIKNNINYSLSKKNNYDFFLSRPYLFLNNFRVFKNLRKYSNFFLMNSYKKHSRLFNTVRRFSSINRIRGYSAFVFQNFFSITEFLSKSNKNKNFMNVKPFFNWFSFFSPKPLNQFFLNKKRQKRTSYYVWQMFSSPKTKFIKKNKFFISNKLIFTKFLSFNRFSKKIKKNNLFIKNFVSAIKLANLTFIKTNWSLDLFYLPPKFVFLPTSKHVFLRLKSFNYIWKNVNIKRFKLKKTYSPVLRKKSSFFFSTIINNLKKPFYISKTKTNFTLSRYGFVFTNGSYIKYSDKTNFFYNFKKNMFSFSYKNEIKRFILRKYTKTNYHTNFSNLSSSPLSLSNSFFFNSQTLNFNYSISSFILNKKNELFSLILQNVDKKVNWLYFNNQINYSFNNESDNTNFNIKRVKFKPGYMTTWRDARSVLKTSLFLKMKYQYKLTNYLSKYKKFINFKTFLFMEMRLLNILIKSRLFNDNSASSFFLKNNLIFLNGRICSNPNIQIFCGDFIQLVINLKYYILYKWFLNLSLKKKNKLKNVLKKKHSNSSQSDEKKKSYSLPKWILYSKNIIDDVPSFLEVDYFTLSLLVLYEPFNWNDISNYNLLEQKFSIINLYNWKYIT